MKPNYRSIGIALGIAWMFATQAAAAEVPTRRIKLATLDWEPYIGQKLPGKGYVHEIVSEAFKKMGYEVEIEFYSWSMALEEAKSGHADGLFPEYYDEKRKSDFVFSDPMPGGPVGFLARKESKISFPVDPRKDPVQAFQKMKQYTYGVVRNYVNTREFDEATYLKKEFVNNDDTNVRVLCYKRVDLIFIDKFVAQYFIKKSYSEFADQIEFLDPPLEIKPLYIVFSNKTPDYKKKLADFNSGLKILEKTGKIKEIMSKYGF